MNLDEIRELIRLMRENGIGEIDVESAGERVRLRATEPTPAAPVYVIHQAGGVQPGMAALPASSMPLAGGAVPGPGPGAAGAAAMPEASPVAERGLVVKSPIVGIFYRASTPDQEPLVEVGDEIDESTVLCIIEAMKVMNEIRAEARGTVRQILAENGQPDEFGQGLFVIDPAE